MPIKIKLALPPFQEPQPFPGPRIAGGKITDMRFFCSEKSSDSLLRICRHHHAKNICCQGVNCWALSPRHPGCKSQNSPGNLSYYSLSRAGNATTNSERPSLTTTDKSGIPSHTEGERFLEMLWRFQKKPSNALSSRPWSRGRKSGDRTCPGFSGIFPEFLPENPSRPWCMASLAGEERKQLQGNTSRMKSLQKLPQFCQNCSGVLLQHLSLNSEAFCWGCTSAERDCSEKLTFQNEN